MDSQIVAVYCLCDDILKGHYHREDPQCWVSDAEIMRIAVVVALFFAGNQERILPKHIHTVTAAGFELKVALFIRACPVGYPR